MSYFSETKTETLDERIKRLTKELKVARAEKKTEEECIKLKDKYNSRLLWESKFFKVLDKRGEVSQVIYVTNYRLYRATPQSGKYLLSLNGCAYGAIDGYVGYYDSNSEHGIVIPLTDIESCLVQISEKEVTSVIKEINEEYCYREVESFWGSVENEREDE